MTKRIHLIRSRILYVFQSVWSVAVLIGVLFAISIINVGCHRGDHLKPEIIGKVWKWEQTLYNNDTITIPAEPDQYTLKLQPDGTAEVQAGCNRGGGTYSKQNSSIAIHILHMTRAMCPTDLLEEEFLRNLAAVALYFVQDGNLYFDLTFDTGTMKFSKK